MEDIDVVELLVVSRVEAVEAGIDKADPKCRSHFLTKLPQKLYNRKSTNLYLDDMDECEFER